jgi:hypothetical protein
MEAFERTDHREGCRPSDRGRPGLLRLVRDRPRGFGKLLGEVKRAAAEIGKEPKLPST